MRRVLYFPLWWLVIAIVGWPELDAATIDDLNWDSSGETVVITDCDTEATGVLVIPEMIDGKPVGAVGDYAFQGCSSLTSVTIPDGVNSMGWSTFRDCSSLTSVMIPGGVTVIGGAAFYDCSSLTSVAIPDGVTEIGWSAFRGCSSLTGVTIPDGVTVIGDLAFYGCSSLTSVMIPDGVTMIEDHVFYDCNSLTNVSIPDGVTVIGWSAFQGCSSLTSVTIPGGVTVIGDQAFEGCSSLTSMTIPGDVTVIGDSLFDGCSSLRSVMIPDGVTVIGGAAFRRCSGLTSVTIPDGVTEIGWSAFRGCSSLTSVTIPDGVTVIGDLVFRDCSDLTSVTIPAGVASIGNFAFRGCSNLTSMTIPNRLTVIGNQAFLDCSSLTSVFFEGDAPVIGTDVFSGVHYDAAAFVMAGAQGFGAEFGGLPVFLIADLNHRFLFYNDSAFDHSSDSGAVAIDKVPLFPGQEATFANFTSYSKGINGVMVDLSVIPDPDGIGADDFVFRVGNSQDITEWVAAPVPQSIDVVVGGGEDGSDRIKIIWANNAIEKQWLEVTVLSNADTGLIEDDVFYFGNAIGESGNDLGGTAVNISDENGARQNPRNFLDPAPIDDPYDFNRDGFVNISDENAARQNGTNFLTELVMLDLTDARPTGERLSRAAIGGIAGGSSASDRVRIRSAEGEGELLIEVRLPEGRLFELQFREAFGTGEWKVVGVVEGTGVEVNRWTVTRETSMGVYRIVPTRLSEQR